MRRRRIEENEVMAAEFDRAAIYFNTEVATKFLSEHLESEITSVDLVIHNESSTTSERERRISQRTSKDLSLIITRPRDGKTLRASCQDFSLTGVGLETFTSVFKTGDFLQLEFEASNDTRRFFAEAIVKSNRQGPNKSHLGLEICSITPLAQQQLRKLIGV